jgi:hypothetical protein
MIDILNEHRVRLDTDRPAAPDTLPAPPPRRVPFVAGRALRGSLPVDPNDRRAGMLFAPPHPRPAPSAPPPTAAGSAEPAAADGAHLVPAATRTDADLPELARQLLLDDAGSGNGTPTAAHPLSTANATYDFDEYVLLRSTEDPISTGLGNAVIPADPRFARFTAAAQSGIAWYVGLVRLTYGAGWNTAAHDVLAAALVQTLGSWWRDVVAVRAFNRLGRYRRDVIESQTFESPEDYYADALCYWLLSDVPLQVADYLRTNGNAAKLGKLLTVAYWESVLDAVFQNYFTSLPTADPTAPEGAYPFDPFPDDEVLFGLRVIHRQTWRLLGYARGDLVKTVPLGPRESRKISIKTTHRTKTTTTSEQVTSEERTADTTTTSKSTSEVIDEAGKKLNRHAEGEVSGGYGEYIHAKVSGSVTEDTAASSKQTKSRLNESVAKTASRMKRDTKVAVSTETETGFELSQSSELVNPNDEIAVTYLYHRLQQQFWVSTEIGEVDSVVFVPEPLPDWASINEDWVRAHGDVLGAALLDPAFAGVLTAIRTEPGQLEFLPTNVFSDAAQAGIASVKGYQQFPGGGALPDMLAAGQMFFERDLERRSGQAMDAARRQHQSAALIAHIRRNILHYMRAIWASEDYDQRMQRYARMRVATAWVFVPLSPPAAGTQPTPLETEGIFVPLAGSARPLTEVIDPVGPIGYLFNCAIYRLRDDPKLINLHQALAYLRASYTAFPVTTTPSTANLAVRQAVAYAPRAFRDQFAITYRSSRGKWLLPRPSFPEADWYEVAVRPDGSLDVRGVRLWVDGTPADHDEIAVTVHGTGELADPHLRLVQLLNPLPPNATEADTFTDDLLAQMVRVLPELATGTAPSWAALTAAQKATLRAAYHRFLMLRESGRLVPLDTANLVVDLEVGQSAALEPFKRLHRYVDVLKEYEEYLRRHLESSRRDALLKINRLGDPDVERVTLVGAPDAFKDLVAVSDGGGE